MGSVNDVRNALLETWDHAVQRTGMVVMSADSVDTLAITITRAMAAADDRPDVVDLLGEWRRADFGRYLLGLWPVGSTNRASDAGLGLQRPSRGTASPSPSPVGSPPTG